MKTKIFPFITLLFISHMSVGVEHDPDTAKTEGGGGNVEHIPVTGSPVPGNSSPIGSLPGAQGGGSNGGYSGSTQPPQQSETNTLRQKCLESNQQAQANLSQCNAEASANYVFFLEQQCAGGGQVSIGGEVVIKAEVTVDEYTQCRDIGMARKENAKDSCQVIFDRAVKVCP